MEISKRIRWVRNQLDIPQTDIYRALDIPQSTYNRMEYGEIGNKFDRIFKIVRYMDHLWQMKYSLNQNYPVFEGETLKEVTFTWIFLGDDPYASRHARELAQLRQVIGELRNEGL